MKAFATELGFNYATYSFGYCLYVHREPADQLGHIYNAGYLPFTAAQVENPTAYMARSVRLQLENWQLNSENRRVYRQFENLERQEVPVQELQNNKEMLEFCLAYFAERHGIDTMPENRLAYILASGWVTHIVQYFSNGKCIAYIWLGKDALVSHFFYSFYDLTYVNQSLGLWLMIDTAIELQKEGQHYLYLGTAYGEKGRYKTNFDQLEWWNGQEWTTDRKLLRALCLDDAERKISQTDRWRENLEHF